MVPFAAASIGQVHRATLSPSSPLFSKYASSSSTSPFSLAVKIQFPGVRSSIKSDLSNLKFLLVASSILPRGLYLENTLRVMERELDDECDYEREAQCGVLMKTLLERETDGVLVAPTVVEELCAGMVLTTEMMHGVALSKTIGLDQGTRDMVRDAFPSFCWLELSDRYV